MFCGIRILGFCCKQKTADEMRISDWSSDVCSSDLYTKLKVLDRFDGCAAGRGDAHHGEVHVVRRVAGYKKIRYYTHENIGYGPVNLPDQELHTTAAWWQLPQTVLLRAFASKQDALDGFLDRKSTRLHSSH